MGIKSIEISLKLRGRPTSGIAVSWKDVSVWAKKKKEPNLLKFWSPPEYEHVKILNKVSGFVKSGTLMAIMGASGAGKTTLLATISQRVKGTNNMGDILVNGKSINKDMMSRLSGFVPQEELVIKTLTVQEHMQFMARLMMDRRVGESQRNRRISSLLSELGLTKCAYTTLGTLSGGEMKRVSLAVQLLTDPPLLFCDEPTTGLDSYNAGIVVEKLRTLALHGKAVICTIHQPASGIFELFHDVLLLAGGRVAFHGKVTDAAKHFENLGLRCPVGYNPAEFYVSELAIISDREEECQRKVQNLCDQFDRSEYGAILRQLVNDGDEKPQADFPSINTYDDDLIIADKEFQKYSNIQKVSWCTQLSWLLWRSSLDANRTKQSIVTRFALYMVGFFLNNRVDTYYVYERMTTDMTLVFGRLHKLNTYYTRTWISFIAFLVATPYINITNGIDQRNIQNIEGLMYLIITETVFTFAYAVFHTFPAEIPQLLREIGGGLYKPSPYYISKILLSIPGTIFMPFVYTTVIFWTVGLRGGFFDFLMFCIPVITSAIAATAYGFALSAAFESIDTAALISVPIDFITITFSGVFLNLSNLPMHINWLRYISPFYYGTEAISGLQWSLVDEIECENDPGFPCIKTGKQVLEKYGFDANDFYLDLIGLAGFYFVLQTVGYLGFWRRSKKQSVY